jgi:tryptophan synthase alpha chain
MSDRIAGAMAGAGSRPVLIPYLTAGFPRAEETVDLLLALEDGGADLIELGLPFSDPLADGPVIQSTSQRALEAGIDHHRILELAAVFRRRSRIPLIFMGYVNPILAFGAERFFAEAAAAGVDGLIVPDLPPEEADRIYGDAGKHGLSWIFLAAPTSSEARLREVDRRSTDFSYCVSIAGVTGARGALPAGIGDYLARVRAALSKPFVVGFGISSPEQMGQVCPPAAGVVVGSALLTAIDAERDAAGRRRRATAFLKDLRG